MSERIMEGSWNPGGAGTLAGGDVWPIPVDCLMNGMHPAISPDGHLALFGNPLVLPHQFRNRFPHSGIHFPIPGQLAHHNSLGHLNIPPPHSMVETSDPLSLVGPRGDTPPDQESHPQPLDLNNDHHHGLEDSEEDSEEDEDDEDVSEEEMDEHGFVHPHEQQVNMSTMSHPPLGVNEDSLPSCQHSQQQTGVINGDSLQSNLIPGLDESCHQKNHLQNGLSHRHPHEEEIPPMSHGHPLNSNPISAIPMITGNPSLLSDIPEDEFSENPPPLPQIENDVMDADPTTGHSVHGKMYVESRVVFHLKQWTDSGFGSFNSCRELQPKSQIHRCAVCRLKSPNGQDSIYNDQQKDAHRHSVKGVILSYDDCIIVELYPEQLPGIGCNSHSHPLDPKQNIMVPPKTAHPMPSYLNPTVDPHTGAQLDGIVPSNISLEKPPTIEQSPEDETQGQSWWDEFDSQRAEAEQDSSPDPNNGDVHQSSSCIMNLKLEAQSMQHQYQQQQQQQQQHSDTHVEKSMEQDGDSNGEMTDYHFKWKCDRCAIGFLASDQFESHRCLTTLNVPEPEPIDQSAPPGYIQNDSEDPETEIIPNEEIELEESHEIVEVINEKIVIDVKPKSKPKIVQEDKRLNELKSAAKYPCPVCEKPFNLKKLLKQHLEEQHESGNPFQCGQCKTQYTDEKRLKRHSCTLSVQSLKNRQQKHQNQVESSMKLANNKASDDDDDDNETDLNSNEPTTSSCNAKKLPDIEVDVENSNDITSSCPISKKRKTDDGQGKVKKKKFKNEKASKESVEQNHMTPGPSSQNQKVEEMGELEDEDYDYETQTRFLSTNPKEEQSQAENKAKNKFKCNICGKSFTVERRLINHKASHKTDRSSQCEKCGKKFARKDKLMRHMYVHSEEKMFVCEICDKRFSRRDKLTDHLKSHGTDEIHNCPMCQKQFLRPDILKQHVKLHRMGNKHQCPECLRFVTGQERLTKHMARHVEAKALGQTLLCPLCTKYFIQKQSLKAHFKKFHPDSNIQLDSESAKFDGSADFPDSSNDSSDDIGLDKDPLEVSTNVTPPETVTSVCLPVDNAMSTTTAKSNITKPQPFSCEYCKKSFVKKYALRRHKQLKHPQTDDNDETSPKGPTLIKENTVIAEKRMEIEELKEEYNHQSHTHKSEESNSSALSSLSPSSSPPIINFSILQQPEHQVQMSNSALTPQDLEIPRDLENSDQSHLSMLHTSGSLHQAHISAYPHHLTMGSLSSLVTVNGNSSASLLPSTIQQSLQTGGDTGHPQQIHHLNMGMGGQPLCPTTSYVLNYHPPYHYQ